MATIEEIKQQAEAVKNATQVGENTAERVGGALAGLADIAKEQEDNIRKKADKDSIVQESGDAEDKVMSQKAVSDKLSDLKEEINDSFESVFESVDNDKYSEVVLSRNKRIVESTDTDGNKTIYGNLTVNGELISPVIENINQSLDEKKFDKVSVVQETGTATDKVMSQKATSTELNKKANTADVDTKFTEEKKRVDGELNKKFDKDSIVQTTGDAEDKVMSQKAVSDKLSDLKEEINDSFESVFESVDNDKYSEVVLSRNKRIVESTDTDGNKTIYGNLTVNGELISPVIENINQSLDEKKFDKVSVVQETGTATDKVMSQKAVSDKLSDLKEEINDSFESVFESVDNDKYSEVVLSRNKRIVESTDTDGNKTIYGNLTVNGELISPVIENINQSLDEKIDGEYVLQERYTEVLVDDDKKIIESIDKTGKHNFNCGIGIANFESDTTKYDAQYVIVELDADDKIHHAVKKDGTHVFPVDIEVPKQTDIYKGVCINALGDSLSNGFEYMFGCRDSLNMKIGGSMVGGSPISGNGEFAFWKDNRINALSAEAKIILIQGGTNDYNQVGDLDITNTDTNTLCGAFNVMMSKLYYKYLSKVNAYYSDVDYTGITRVEHPVKRLPIVVMIPPLAPSPQYEARVTRTAKALVDISMLWGLDIIDARRIGYNVISGAGIDMVHGAKKFFDVLSDKIVSYFTDVAKSMSHLKEEENPNFRITVNANEFGGKSDAFAAVDDIVYITLSSLPNDVIVKDKGNNTIPIEWVDRLTNLACQFKMPNSDVVVTIN